MTVPLPTITHQQYAVLAALRRGEVPGRVVRDRLGEVGVRRSGPSFYQFMARMEEAGLVTGRYEQALSGDQRVRERHYRATPAGEEAAVRARRFYHGGTENG